VAWTALLLGAATASVERYRTHNLDPTLFPDAANAMSACRAFSWQERCQGPSFRHGTEFTGRAGLYHLAAIIALRAAGYTGFRTPIRTARFGCRATHPTAWFRRKVRAMRSARR